MTVRRTVLLPARPGSEAETALIWQIRAAKLPSPTLQHKAIPGRKFAFDLAWPAWLLAVEVDGAVWTQGRHTRGSGVETDCEKYSLAAAHGWRVIRCTPGQVDTGQALAWIEQALMLGLPEFHTRPNRKDTPQ
jgi:very-short-patch-repair endonuclease